MQTKYRTPTNIGDAVVSGLLAGILAGVIMVAYLVAVGFLMGDTVAATLVRFDPGMGAMPLVGLLTHLAVSGIYGMIWGLLLRLSQRFFSAPTWLLGLIYGLLLYLVAQGLFQVASSPLAAVPALHFLVAHAVYGLALGVQARKS